MKALVYGGSGSGKSAWAEGFCARFAGRSLYLATMKPQGEEAWERIARHQKLRAGKGFATLEYSGDPRALTLEPGWDCLLLEDAGNLVSAALFDRGDSPEAAEQSLFDGIFRLSTQVKNFILVTNDIFSDGASHEEGTAAFARCLSGLNRRAAFWADAVVEVVCGLPICHKGEGIPL